MSAAPALSLDLILEILDCLAVPVHFPQRSCDLSVLVACSTVCKVWSAHAQRLLFRRVILPANIYREPQPGRITPSDSMASFLAAIDPTTDHGRWLAESVVGLTIRPTGGRTGTCEPTWLATAMLRTPNLRHLDVTANCLDPKSLARLRQFGPPITSLRLVKPISPVGIYDSHIMQQIIACFPSTRILEIGSFAPVLAPFNPPLKLSLVSFTYHVAIELNVTSYLTSLLNPNPEADSALQVLSTKGSNLALGRVLTAHGTHLRSLTVERLDPGQPHLAATCPHLERLAIRCFPHAEILALVPRSISTLAISGMTPIPGEVDGLVQALESFSRLKTLEWSSCSPTYSALPAIASVCQRQGIKLCLSAEDKITEDPLELQLRRKYIRI
ncbi:hypothetical protein DFH06DRAFT_1182458 [Mycena polygramma]|nr:hypothetical protein DFH06DRAFT_1182458 [Mycena polygramma]